MNIANSYPANEEIDKTLLHFWKTLKNVKQLNFTAQSDSHSKTQWNGKGVGSIDVLEENTSSLVFEEKGLWQGEYGDPLQFFNIFRWTLDLTQKIISLEHLRQGRNRPVFLFDLQLLNTNTLVSIYSHLCKKDSYFGKMSIDADHVHFTWKITGPKKSETLTYIYS